MNKNNNLSKGDLVTVIPAHPEHKTWTGFIVDIGSPEVMEKHQIKNLPPLVNGKIYCLVIGKPFLNKTKEKLKTYVFVKENLEKIEAE